MIRAMRNNKISWMKNAAVIALAAVLAGCASNIGANQYDAFEARSISATAQGTVISLRPVTVSENSSASQNTGGMALGAITGAIVGSTIGGGSGQLYSAAGGALLGGAAGALTSQQLGTQDAIEYVIELEDGQLVTLVQGTDIILTPGESVLVQYSRYGQSRAIPFSGGGYQPYSY